MIKITNLLLIHWHYFNVEVVPFGQLNFLTGKNASGKSTLIDAMQIVLYGDTSGYFFNKAASGKGSRNIIGYLRGELGDNDEAGFNYIRNDRFSSYIALEFYDEKKETYFTAGCCFDVYSDNTIKRMFFIYDGELPENNFIIDNTPMKVADLRGYIKEIGGDYTEVGRDYHEKLSAKLGNLRKDFTRLLKKAVSFDPDVDIQKFISEFVCNSEQTVDVRRMQDNIAEYKKLEKTAETLTSRIQLLNEISGNFDDYKKNEESEKVYKYILDKAEVEIAETTIRDLNNKKVDAESSLSKLNDLVTDSENLLTDLEKEHLELNISISNNEQEQAIKQLRAQQIEKEKELSSIVENFKNSENQLTRVIAQWTENSKLFLDKSQSVEGEFSEELKGDAEDLKTKAEEFLEKLKATETLTPESIIETGLTGYLELSNFAKSLSNQSFNVISQFEKEEQRLNKEKAILDKNKNELEKGIQQFPQTVINLKESVKAKILEVHNKVIDVVIVAEVSDIINDRWRNAVEGYLNTRRFYVIVPPEYFQTALEVYEFLNKERNLHETGIIDIEKIKQQNPQCKKGSLAEEIKTDNEFVRLYLDSTLGFVMKCDTVHQLRQHNTAITDSCMLYNSFVVRAINSKHWKMTYIGQDAVVKGLENAKKEIDLLNTNIDLCKTMLQALNYSKELVYISTKDIDSIILSTKNFTEKGVIETEINSLLEKINSIDDSAIKGIKEQITQLKAKISKVKKDNNENLKKTGEFRERVKELTERELPNWRNNLEVAEEKLSAYEKEWVIEVGSPKFERELSNRNSAFELRESYSRVLPRFIAKRRESWEGVLDLRRKYNIDYKMGYDINILDNEFYNNILEDLSKNELPKYVVKIDDIKGKAYERFREDFLSRLEHNIQDAKRQINELNQSLKGSNFGEDTYRFIITPKQEYKRYYDMFTDTMKLTKSYDLFSLDFNNKYKKELEELFNLLTNSDTISFNSEENEKRIKMYSDYRTYIAFDLEVTNKDGDTQRLSKTMGKKSGGETQTPFYIAVLASFAQLYRIGRANTNDTCRLIIFDEAFSKMDGERITKSVELLREFDFQAIISAPPDKIGDIVPLMDNNICVLRAGKKSTIKTFELSEMEKYKA